MADVYRPDYRVKIINVFATFFSRIRREILTKTEAKSGSIKVPILDCKNCLRSQFS